MEYINLGTSDLRVSRLCVGGCPMGGYGWGRVEKQDLIGSVQEALEQGVNFFDTADTYGLGESERTLGTALQGKRHHAIIATKFGVRVEKTTTYYDNTPEWIERALAESLKRLQTDYIDLYQIHYRDEKTPLEDVVEALRRLKKKGYIRYFGLSNIYEKDILEFSKLKSEFVSFQDEYSLACRTNESSICLLKRELELTPLTWGSLGQGVLSGKYDETTVFNADDRRSREVYVNFHGEKMKHNLKIVSELKEISIETGKSIPAIAIRFIMDHLVDSAVLVGVKRPDQLYSNLEALNWKLSDGQMNRLLEVSRC